MSQRDKFTARLARIGAVDHAKPAAGQRWREPAAEMPRPARAGRAMVALAFAAGAASALLGPWLFAVIAGIAALPPEVNDLGAHGALLTSLFIAALFIAIFGLLTRDRLKALIVGAVIAHFAAAVFGRDLVVLLHALTGGVAVLPPPG